MLLNSVEEMYEKPIFEIFVYQVGFKKYLLRKVGTTWRFVFYANPINSSESYI